MGYSRYDPAIKGECRGRQESRGKAPPNAEADLACALLPRSRETTQGPRAVRP